MDGEQRTPGWLVLFGVVGIILSGSLLLGWLFDGSQASHQFVGAIFGLVAVAGGIYMIGYVIYVAARKLTGSKTLEGPKK